MGSATFTIQMSLYMAVVVYAPALALSQGNESFQLILYLSTDNFRIISVTNIDVIYSVTAIFVVCIFYTAVVSFMLVDRIRMNHDKFASIQGGLKAVIWTDTVQVVIMYISMLTVIIKGDLDIGGTAEVWRRNAESGRVEFDEYTTSHFSYPQLH
jgi:solute carrier family 5 (sodium-coupled monocarboxylate transporter), member 8/12